MGLLRDDKEFIDSIIESNNLASGIQLRRLFVTLLLMNTMSRQMKCGTKHESCYQMTFYTKKERSFPTMYKCFIS